MNNSMSESQFRSTLQGGIWGKVSEGDEIERP